jgi:hypothetical protein
MEYGDACESYMTEVPATCTGTATADGVTCDLDAATDDSADCPEGCTATEATMLHLLRSQRNWLHIFLMQLRR